MLATYNSAFAKMMERSRRRPVIFIDEMGRAHGSSQQMFADLNGVTYDSVQEFEPPFELLESDKHYTLRFELPGIHKESIDLRINVERKLIIRGMKERPQIDDASPYRSVSEIVYGPFKRIIQLPEDVSLNTSSFSEAIFENGVLTVFLPKVESVGIKIK